MPIREEPQIGFVSHGLSPSQAALLPSAKGAALLARVLGSFPCLHRTDCHKKHYLVLCGGYLFAVGVFGLIFFHFQEW